MDGIFDTYKQIVDRAIFLGLLSEENKALYLSAIDDDVPTHNNRRTSVSHPTMTTTPMKEFPQPEVSHKMIPLGAPKEKIHNSFSGFSEIMGYATEEDRLSEKGARSIENYSILDINNLPGVKNYSSDSESDISNFLKHTCRVTSNAHPKHPSITVKKKPKKNEIVDFRIPIYVDMKKKKISTSSSRFKGKRRIEMKPQHSAEPNILLEMDSIKQKSMPKTERKNFLHYSQPKRCPRKIDPKRSGLLENGTNSQSLENAENINKKIDERNIHQIFSPRNYRNTLGRASIDERKHDFEEREVQRLCTLHAMEKVETIVDKFTDSIKLTRNNALPNRKKMQCLKHADAFGSLKRWDDLESSSRRQIDSVDIRTQNKSSLNNQKSIPETTKTCGTELKQRLPIASDDMSVKESSDTENKVQGDSEKLLNVNIICHFFRNDASTRSSSSERQHSSNVDSDVPVKKAVQNENAIQSECMEPSGHIAEENQLGQLKEKTNRKQAARFLSKIFSRLKASSKNKS